MKAKSNDNLNNALRLLRRTARRTQPVRHALRNGRTPDIGELFLAELRVRRAHLKQWIEVLNREATAATLRPSARTPLSAPSFRNRSRPAA
jgi:hypothetical protein